MGATFYNWHGTPLRATIWWYGGFRVETDEGFGSDRRTEENRRLKKMYAELSLEHEVVKEALKKK